MGNILNISCRECRYNNEYFLGVGEFFRERNKKSVSIINKLAGIDKQNIIIDDSFIQVFRCFGCNGLFNKLHISYRVKDSLQMIYSVLYKCVKCRQPLYPLFSYGQQFPNHSQKLNSEAGENNSNDFEIYYYEKVIQDIPCYKCGNRKLYLNAWGVFE